MKKILVLFCAFINIAFMQEECSDFLTQDDCLSYDFCEWVSNNPNGMNGMCIEFNNNDWYDNQCSNLTQDECLEIPECDWSPVSTPNGVFEMCVENNWNDYNDWECSDLEYEDCQYFDYCEWISDSDNPAVNGYCVDAEGGNDDGPPDCVLDCEGIENVSPEENATYFCEWLLSVFPSGCAEDCDQEILDDIQEFMNICDECLSDNNCDGIFDDNNDCDPDLECATVITCYEGLLYPTSCGPENCDEPIGECDDYYEGCQSDNGQWYDIGYEMFINYCEYYECTENGWEGPFSLDNDDCSDNNDWECSDLSQYDCMLSDECEWSSYVTPNGFYEGCIDADDSGDWENDCNGLTQDECEWSNDCEWISDSDNPNSWGSCVEIEEDNDGPPECLDDCEGIQDIDPSENPYEACDWIISNFGPNNFFNECAEDCDDETMMEINEIVEACYECLQNEDIDCADVFDDDSNQENCEELNYPDCIENENCEWIITSEWGGYSCVEIEDENNCSDLGYDDCIENPNCEPNYNAAGQFENCDEIDNQPNFGILYGNVEYLYGDYVDFVPYALIHIESLPSNSDILYFETMADTVGHYEIQLPVGAYMVTAYANEESLTHDVQIAPNANVELNFLLGDWGGGFDSQAVLALGDSFGLPGSTVTVPLLLNSNLDSVGGVQFTIASASETNTSLLSPEGIEVINDCFTGDFNEINEQMIGIIFSFEGCTYGAGETIHIADIIYYISNEAGVGSEIPLYFTETIVSDGVGNEIPSYGEGNVVLIGSLGDVNADGEINVLDVVMLVNFAIYIEEPTDSEFWAADLNGDNLINVLDIVQLVNIILEN